MAERSLSYYLGPHLSQGLLNAYNAGRGLLEFVSPGADVRDTVQSSQSAMQNLGQGNVGAGLLDLVYTPAALAGMFIPGSIGGTRRGADGVFDALLRSGDDLVDPTMPARLVNPEMRVFQGGPNKYGPDVPGTKPGLDSSKIGTGEGAQVYGHGHYLAENRGIGEYYRDTLAQDVSTIGDMAVNTARNPQEAVGAWRTASVGLPEDVRSAVADKLSNRLSASEILDDLTVDFYGAYNDEVGAILRSRPGHLYEYDLPDETIDRMLDWDKPLSEQPQAVRDALKNMGARIGGDENLGTILQRASRNELFGGDVVGRDRATRAEISQALREAGIPGIKYLDQGSRSAGDGTRNFVLFDEDAAKLLARDDVRFDKAADALPMDEASRMARAREMGFDTDVYHGTDADISEFKLGRRGDGVSVATTPINAEGYGGITMPLKVRSSGLFDPAKKADVENLTEAVKAYHADNMQNSAALGSEAAANFYPYRLGQVLKGIESGDSLYLELPEVSDILKTLGFEGHIGKEGPFTQAKIFDPKNIRSRFAKFDPAKKDSANILAGVIPGVGVAGLLGAGAYGQQEQ
jgi:hypothetical protein